MFGMASKSRQYSVLHIDFVIPLGLYRLQTWLFWKSYPGVIIQICLLYATNLKVV